MKIGLPLALSTLVILAPVAFAQRPAAAGIPGGAGSAASHGGGSAASPGGAAPASASPSSGSDPTGGIASSALGGDTQNSNSSQMWSTVEKMLDNDNLSVDSENGVFQWKNNKFDIGNNLIVRERFERYLSAPGYGDTDQDYQHILKQIQDLLSNQGGDPQHTIAEATPATSDNTPKGDKVYQAWQLLFEAAKFDQDGGASLTLANQVYNAWRVRDELFQSKMNYADMDQQRKTEQGAVINDTTVAATAAYQQSQTAGAKAAGRSAAQSAQNNTPGGANRNARSASGGSGQTSVSSSGTPAGNVTASGDPSATGPTGATGIGSGSGLLAGSGSDQLPQMITALETPSPSVLQSANKGYFDSLGLAQTYAKQSLLDADMSMMGVQVKLQYQTQLLAFIMERRFQHSLMAGQFFEHIFKGSQQRVTVAQEEISRFMNVDNVVPTVNSFEFISHEAIADVDGTMKSVTASYNSGQVWTALKQLQQAFLLGEMMPSVEDFDPAKRKVLLNIYRESNDLKKTIDLRDFANAEQIIKKIQTDAPDFQAGPILSAIQEGEQTSNLALMSAEQAALAGDNDRLSDSLKTAISLWPMNPEIATFSKTFRDKTTLAGQGIPKFDDMLARGDDRGIYDARAELGMALYQDPDRLAKFKEVVLREEQVEMSVALADQAMKQNNGYAAWEALVASAKIEPNDPVLARTQTMVAARVAPFVAVLDSADRAEKSGDLATSLNYYLQAQDIYPVSQLAHDAIDSLSKRLMAQINPQGSTARALAAETVANSVNIPGAPAAAAAALAPAPKSNSTDGSKSDTAAPSDKGAAKQSSGSSLF